MFDWAAFVNRLVWDEGHRIAWCLMDEGTWQEREMRAALVWLKGGSK